MPSKTTLFIFLLILTLGACASTAFSEALNKMVSDGTITPEQGTAVFQAYTQFQESSSWWEMPVSILGGAVMAWLGVRSPLPLIGRGAPTQKVGLPASLVDEAK